MNNNTTSGIKDARQKNQLENQASTLDRNRRQVGKRDNSSLSFGINSSKSSFFNNSNSKSKILSKNSNDMQAKNRIANNNDRALKVASKIPVPVVKEVSKAAQIAQKNQKLKKNNKRNPFSNMLGKKGLFKNLLGNDKNKEDSSDNVEEETDNNEEPQNIDGRFNISAQTVKKVFIWVLVLVFSSAIFICIILASAITDTAGESYLASHDNPTEKELAEAYSANSSDDSGSDSVSGSGNLTYNDSYTDGNNTNTGFYVTDSEPNPATAINYWSSYLDKDDFVFPKDDATGKPLGAWPKDYNKVKTQLDNVKLYQNNFMWPTTPEGGKYSYVYSHQGIDIMASFGTPVYSPVDGTLVYSTWGHTVNKGSDETAYSVTIIPDKVVNFSGTSIDRLFLTHMSGIRYRCEEGSCNKKVKKGELLGFSGNAAGDSYTVGWAPHLHMTYYNEAGGYNGTGLYTEAMEQLYNITPGTKRSVGQ